MILFQSLTIRLFSDVFYLISELASSILFSYECNMVFPVPSGPVIDFFPDFRYDFLVLDPYISNVKESRHVST